ALTLSFTLLRRRCPCLGDGAACCGQHRRPYWWQPLAGASWAASCGLATSDRPLRVADSPLAGGPWLQPAAPAGGLAVASRRLAGGLGRSRLPLATSHDQPLLLAVLATNTLNNSTRFNLITRSLKPIFRIKTLALIPLLGNLQRVHHMRRLYIPIFQIRMEKMKEVKRPPL
ncbi:hypothetical protein B296_00037553, partial [Ensete ventricosum]